MTTTDTISILNVLMENIQDRLIDQLVTSVSDATKCTLVNVGKFGGQTDFVQLALAIRHGNEAWRHTANINAENIGMEAPFGVIGDGIYWRRRFVIDLRLRSPKHYTQAQNTLICNVIASRAEHVLQNKAGGNWWFSRDMDSFGEYASRVFVLDSMFTEVGGVNAWGYDGIIRVEFLTEKTGCV